MTRAQPTDTGYAELLADAERPGGWLLAVDRIRQSYVDLDDPTYLDFEYVQAFADVLGMLPDGALAVTHVGGAACTFARYVAAVRPGSPQIVLEPDAALTAFVRARLPFPRGARIRVRAQDGRLGVAALANASADLLVLDAFHGGRVPPTLTSAEFLADVARVLRPEGVFLANVADGPPHARSASVARPLTFTRRLLTTVGEHLPSTVVIGDPAVLKGRRFGNLVLAASPATLPRVELARVSARAPFPRVVAEGGAFSGGAARLTDADPMRSPAPPDEIWRMP